MDRHALSILADNTAGVLERVAGLVSRRGFNIDSLSVGETADPLVSRMTVMISCDEHALEQIVRQLEKQVFIRRVMVLPGERRVVRELLLLKVSTASGSRAEILEIANIFRAKVVDVSPESLILEITGDGEKSEALLRIMADYGILEVVRTGATALSRGADSIYQPKTEPYEEPVE